jgi:hypothetical protein
MGPEMSFVDQAPWDPLTLDIYLFERASFTLRDDGESTRLSCSREHEVIRCTMESAGGPARTYLLVLNGITALGSVLLDGQPMARCPSEPELAPLAEGWWATTDRTLVKLQADRKFALEMRP